MRPVMRGKRLSVPVLLCLSAGKVLLCQPSQCSQMVERARQAYDSRQFDTAIASFERALAVCSRRSQILLGLGQSQLMAGRLNSSVESLRAPARIEPQKALIHKVL